MVDLAPASDGGSSGKHRLAIVMPSVGTRPWADRCAETFSWYAAACGATLHVETTLPTFEEFPFPKLADRPGRKMKLAYACKAYFAWSYLTRHGYDRVAVVDDTCCVRAGSPDLFAVVPFGSCGYTRTSASHAQDSFQEIERFVEETNMPAVPFDPRRYMNSGVMVYDRTMTSALSPDKICACAPLLFARAPNQTMMYYLLAAGGVPQHELPKAFNTMPAGKLPTAQRRELEDVDGHIDPGVFIYHLSAFYTHRARLLSQITDVFLKEWRELDPGSVR